MKPAYFLTLFIPSFDQHLQGTVSDITKLQKLARYDVCVDTVNSRTGDRGSIG